jgi:hypothetical protein
MRPAARPARRCGPRRGCRPARRAPTHRSLHPTGHPTCDEMHAVLRSSAGDHHALGLAASCPARHAVRARGAPACPPPGRWRPASHRRPSTASAASACPVGGPLVGEHIARTEHVISAPSISRSRFERFDIASGIDDALCVDPVEDLRGAERRHAAGRSHHSPRGLGRVAKDVELDGCFTRPPSVDPDPVVSTRLDPGRHRQRDRAVQVRRDVRPSHTDRPVAESIPFSVITRRSATGSANSMSSSKMSRCSIVPPNLARSVRQTPRDEVLRRRLAPAVISTVSPPGGTTRPAGPRRRRSAARASRRSGRSR